MSRLDFVPDERAKVRERLGSWVLSLSWHAEGADEASVNTDVSDLLEWAVELFTIEEPNPDKVLTIVLLRDFTIVDKRTRSQVSEKNHTVLV